MASGGLRYVSIHAYISARDSCGTLWFPPVRRTRSSPAPRFVEIRCRKHHQHLGAAVAGLPSFSLSICNMAWRCKRDHVVEIDRRQFVVQQARAQVLEVHIPAIARPVEHLLGCAGRTAPEQSEAPAFTRSS